MSEHFKIKFNFRDEIDFRSILVNFKIHTHTPTLSVTFSRKILIFSYFVCHCFMRPTIKKVIKANQLISTDLTNHSESFLLTMSPHAYS